VYGASLSPAPRGSAVIVDLAVEYRRHAERLIARYPHADMSRLDYAVLRDLAMRRPDATRQALGQALRQGSPNVARRKTNKRWLTAYVEHTTTAVLLNLDVQRARAAYQRKQGRLDLGPQGRGRGAIRLQSWPARVSCLPRVRGVCLCNAAMGEDQSCVGCTRTPTDKKARRRDDGP